ncbi:hypothetical protein HU200_042439 [Digitaria exilis]|uniref:Uncharacterized protein n=1 Tax=Digitaria exilis TaxID=1010633 RepID=A0A835EH40_9POAL|nr:hypothetical protein HU200_042439 [Digitaria exilis]
MGSEAAVVPVDISSDEEDGVGKPAAAAAGKRKSPEGALEWAEKMLAEEDFGADAGGFDPAAMQAFLDSLLDTTGIVMGDKESAVDDKNAVRGACGGGDDDDVDGDPDKPVAVAKEEGPRRDAGEDELQIVAEKGEVCTPPNLFYFVPFRYDLQIVVICHCYVCDSPAPCAFWGKGTVHTDHCHATDKDAKWKNLRQSSKNKNQPTPKQRIVQNSYLSSAAGPFSQFSASVNSSTGRFPVSSVLGQNQRVNSSIGMEWNSVLTAASPMPRATIPSYGSKSDPIAPPVYTSSNVSHVQPSVPSYAPMQPAKPRPFQAAQAPPRGRIAGPFQSHHTQLRSSVPIGSQGLRYAPPSFPQLPPNMVVGTGVPLSRSTSVATQGTQYQQVPSTDRRLKEKEALASLARQLGVPDYDTSQPIVNVSTAPSLHPSQLHTQAKASQCVQPKKRYVAAASQMRPSIAHNSPNQASGGTVRSSDSIQIQQRLCQLNSQSNITPTETAPSTLQDGK